MKLTNRKILNDSNFLRGLIHKQLPIKVSYAIAKNVSKIEKELEIYNKERQKLLDKYCVKDEKGNLVIDESNNYSIEEEYIDICNKELNELLDIEVDIDIHKFKLNDLLQCNLEVSPADLSLIDYMIEE
jgi:GTPase Era involved in 16S rRNA processing